MKLFRANHPSPAGKASASPGAVAGAARGATAGPVVNFRSLAAMRNGGTGRGEEAAGASMRSPLSRAFTLIEIMIVVGIIGLVAAMGLPSILKELQKEGMRKAVSDVQDVFFTARERAIISGKTTKAVFHIQDRRFGVEGDSAGVNSHSGKTTSATLPSGIEFGMFDIYHQDYAESDSAWIFFNPDGTCDDGVVIVLLGRGEKRFITLDFATGMSKSATEFR